MMPAGRLPRYPLKSLAGTVTLPGSLISAGKTCSSVMSRSVARTRIALSTAVSSTLERIGTVVWALTTLLAAPTADAMSFVLQLNFTYPLLAPVLDLVYKNKESHRTRSNAVESAQNRGDPHAASYSARYKLCIEPSVLCTSSQRRRPGPFIHPFERALCATMHSA